MSDKEKIEEETYSLIFSSLKHPIRRRILRMLAREPQSFSKILDALSIDSGHLNYHLESLGELIRRSDGKYGLSSIGVAAVKLMSGVEEPTPLKVSPEEPFSRTTMYLTKPLARLPSRIWVIILTPLLLVGFWLFQQAAITNKYFLELTFSSFIFLGIIALLLRASRIKEASRKIKIGLYAVTLISLIATAAAAGSLATVPRAKRGEYAHDVGEDIQDRYSTYTTLTGGGDPYSMSVNIYTGNRTVGWVQFFYDHPHIEIYSDRDVLLDGTAIIYFILIPEPDEGSHRWIYHAYIKPIHLQGNYTYLSMLSGGLEWGGYKPEDRIRLSNYRVMFRIRLELDGLFSEYPNLNLTIHPYFEWHIGSLWVDSELQNGLALFLCGVFAAIYIEILGKGVIQAIKQRKRKQ